MTRQPFVRHDGKNVVDGLRWVADAISELAKAQLMAADTITLATGDGAEIVVTPTQWLPNDVCAMLYQAGEGPLPLLVAHGKGIWGHYRMDEVENAAQQLVRCQSSRQEPHRKESPL